MQVYRNKPELLAHPLVLQIPMRTRDAVYGGGTEAMRLHYKARENANIQYDNVMIFYPYLRKFYKFPVVQKSFTQAMRVRI